MNKKSIAVATSLLLLAAALAPIAMGGSPLKTNVYVMPRQQNIDVGNTTTVRLMCNTTQAISGWGFEYINFTAGVININKIRTGHYSPSSDDYYIFQDNSTIDYKGTINNATGIVGGSWANCYQSADIDGGWINSTNRTVMNITVKGVGCGIANITVYDDNGKYFAVSGIAVPCTYHTKTIAIHPARPSSFTATTYGSTQINLSWGKVSSATTTVVRGKLGSYPTSTTDGTWGVNTTFQKANQTSLTAGQHWYYRIWSWNDTAKLMSGWTRVNDALLGTLPSIYVQTPKNQTTGLNRQPLCKINANESGGVSLTVNWYSSTDGSSFTHQQKNSAVVANSTVQWNYSFATSYLTQYWWKVSADNGITNVTKVFWFRTRGQPTGPNPSIYVVYPKNQTTANPQPTITIKANDTQSLTLTINWYENHTGSWIKRQRDVQLANQTAQWQDIYATTSNTYWWRVTVNDGTLNVSKTFNFICTVWHNITMNLIYNASAGGGLNFLSVLSSTDASTLASTVGPFCVQVVTWNASQQTWQAYVPGVGGNYNLNAGMSAGIEVSQNTSITIDGYAMNNVRNLYYTTSGGGGLNCLGRTNGTTTASAMAAAVTPSTAVAQVLYWNGTAQDYMPAYIPGVGIDFTIPAGMAVYIEVTGNATLRQAGW